MTALEGVVQRVIYQSGSFFIFELTLDDAIRERKLWTARGYLFGLTRLAPRASVQLQGTWKRHSKYGQQFQVKSWEPWYRDRESFQVFFSQCLKHCDMLSVDAICSRYGADVLDALKVPGRVLDEVSSNRSDLQATVLGWEQALATRDLSLFLRGMVATDIEAAITRFGSDAATILRRNPYRLLEIPGFSFEKADEFAESLGFSMSSPERVGGAILWALARARDSGHLFLRPEDIPSVALEIPCERPVRGDFDAALRGLAQARTVLMEGRSRVYLPEYYEYERVAAAHLAALIVPSTLSVDQQVFLEEFQASTQLSLSEAQKDVVRALSKSRILVITGLPGTGKSTSVRALVRLFEEARVSFALMAPTGIAAKRLSSITGHPAGTIHRSLGFDGNVWGHGADNKLIVDAVIVDEVSMVDQELIYRLLVALRRDTVLVLVGDADQLPSVGPGNVLKELTACPALPRVELTQIFRQAKQGDIVSNSHRINRGELPELGDPKGNSEFKFVPLHDDHQVKEYIVRMAAKLKARDANFQVLAAKYGGAVGVHALNEALREVLNPPGPPEWKGETQHFRVGDRLMVVKNDYKKNVYNGDVGKLLRIEREHLIVRIYGLEDDLQVSFSEPDAEEKLRLAYAVTVHRSQGNEFDTIIMPVVLEQKRMLQRNLLYTAVTRAKKQVWLLGQKSALQRAVDNNRVTRRNTVLNRAIVGVLRRPQPEGEAHGSREDREHL